MNLKGRTIVDIPFFMLEEISRSVTKAIENANTEIEQSWESIYEVTNLFNQKEYSDYAFRRLISYNPTNQKINSASETQTPNAKAAIDEITRVLNEISNRIEKDPENLSSWIKVGHCYLLLGDFPNAYSAYSNVLRLNTNENIDDAYFWYCIGSIYQHFKYNKAALKYLSKAAEIAPNLQQISDLKFRIALVHRSLQHYDESLKKLKSLISTRNIPSNLAEDDIEFQIAYTYQLMGENEKAKQCYSNLYSKYRNNPQLIQQYCWFLSLQNDNNLFEMAESIINSFDPLDPTLKFVMARIAMKRQDMHTAYDLYNNCISYWSESPLFWCGLGVLYFKNDQMQDAVIAFQRALYLNSELVEAWANLGLIFELQEDKENSLKIYQSAIAKCSDSKLLRDRLQAVHSGRSKLTNRDYLEANDSKLFMQVAERIATEYIATPPVIPAHQVDINLDTQALVKSLKLYYNSLFAS